jgi:hypothetical protein
MARTFAKTAILALGLALAGCGNTQEKAASPPQTTEPGAAAAPAASIAHGDTLCDLAATHFASLLPANPDRHAYPSGDMCKVGGPSPRVAQVRVIFASHGGMTPALLSSFRVAGHTIADAPDLGEGAFVDTLSPGTSAAKTNVVAEKNGHLITIEIEFARPITDADVQSARTLSYDFIAAL